VAVSTIITPGRTEQRYMAEFIFQS